MMYSPVPTEHPFTSAKNQFGIWKFIPPCAGTTLSCNISLHPLNCWLSKTRFPTASYIQYTARQELVNSNSISLSRLFSTRILGANIESEVRICSEVNPIRFEVIPSITGLGSRENVSLHSPFGVDIITSVLVSISKLKSMA